MEHYETSFFTNYSQPRMHIDIFQGFNAVVIESNQYKHGKITIYFSDESKLIEFINSVKGAYEQYRREKGYDRGE